MKKKVDVARSGSDHAARGFDFIGGRVGFGAKFSDSFAVDPDLAGEDELFRMTARSDAGAGDDLLEAFEHEGFS